MRAIAHTHVLALPVAHLARPRLRAAVDGAELALVLASGGFGKTVLAADRASRAPAAAVATLAPGDTSADAVAARLLRALRRARWSDAVAAAAGAGDAFDAVDAVADVLAAGDPDLPQLLVVDDIHHATGDAAEALHRLVGTRRGPLWLHLSGRTTSSRLRRAARDHGAVELDDDALRFTPDETGAYLARVGIDADVAAVQRVTGGWPAAVALAAARHRRSGAGPAPTPDRRLIGDLVAEVLADLDPADQLVARRLAALPWVDPPLARDVLGDAGVLDRLTAAGLPLTSPGGGPLAMADVAREVLAVPLDPAFAEHAARGYAARDDVAAATHLLVAAGLPDRAAALLADLSPARTARMDVPELRALVTMLPPATVDAHPQAWLHLARALVADASVTERRAVLDRLEQLPLDPALRLAVQVERAHDTLGYHTEDEAAALAQPAVESPDADPATRARAADILARIAAWRQDVPGLRRAERLFRAAADAATAAGIPEWAATSLLGLASRVHHVTMAYDRAAAAHEEALALAPPASRLRALIQTFHVSVLSEVGRFEDAAAAVADATPNPQRLEDVPTPADPTGADPQLAPHRGDAARAVEAFAATERIGGDWMGTPAGVMFLAEAADYLDRVGEAALADRYLERALPDRDRVPDPVIMAETAIAVRRGEVGRAREVLTAARAFDEWSPRDRARLAVMDAYLVLREQRPDVGAVATAAISGAVAAAGPQATYLLDPEMVGALLPLVAASGSAAAELLAALPPTVAVLGGFRVAAGGATVALRDGMPSRLVKLLACRRDPVPAVEAAEVLWPGVAEPDGRRRLRNVLNRVGQAVPGLVERDGTALRLGDDVTVDARAFADAAREALRVARLDRTRAVARAQSAVARYHGELLPGDRDQPWTVAARQTLHRLHLQLLELLADDAERRGDLDEAVRLRRRAAETDPLDEAHQLALARLWLAQGRRQQAIRALEAARQILDELAVAPPPAYRQLLAALHAAA